jgi:hypothetical protein
MLIHTQTANPPFYRWEKFAAPFRQQPLAPAAAQPKPAAAKKDPTASPVFKTQFWHRG